MQAFPDGRARFSLIPAIRADDGDFVRREALVERRQHFQAIDICPMEVLENQKERARLTPGAEQFGESIGQALALAFGFQSGGALRSHGSKFREQGAEYLKPDRSDELRPLFDAQRRKLVAQRRHPDSKGRHANVFVSPPPEDGDIAPGSITSHFLQQARLTHTSFAFDPDHCARATNGGFQSREQRSALLTAPDERHLRGQSAAIFGADGRAQDLGKVGVSFDAHAPGDFPCERQSLGFGLNVKLSLQNVAAEFGLPERLGVAV